MKNETSARWTADAMGSRTPQKTVPEMSIWRIRSLLRFWPALFILSLTLRGLYLWEIREAPWFRVPVVDANEYDLLAREISSGELVHDHAFWHPPLYPHFLALVYTVFGTGPWAPRLIQAVLGSLSAVLTFFLGKRYFDRTTGIAAGLTVAFYGPLIHADGQLLAESLATFLATGALLILARLQQVRSPGSWRITLLGLTTGLAAITRSLLAILWPIGLIEVVRRGRSVIRRGTLLTVSFLIPLLPPMIHNYLAEGRFEAVSTEAGINFYLGNAPDSEQLILLRPGLEWQRFVSEPAREDPARTSSERSWWFIRKGLQSIARSPASLLARMSRKVWLFWRSPEIPRNHDEYGIGEVSFIQDLLMWRWGPVGFPFAVLGPFALAGMWVARGRWREIWPLLIFVWGTCLGLAILFVTGRYRLPVIPVLSVFAGAFGCALVRSIRSKPALAWKLGAVAAAGFVIVNSPYPGTRKYDIPETSQLTEQGQAFFAYGQPGQAEAYARQALALDKENPDAWLLLARALAAQGYAGEADLAFVELLVLRPEYEQVHMEYGKFHLAHGDFYAAEMEFEECLRLAPGAPAPHLYLARIAASTGRRQKAETHFRAVLKVNPENAEAREGLEDLEKREDATEQGGK